MDTYVFVEDLNGNERVNPAQRGLEGRNLMDVQALKGNFLVLEQIEAAMKSCSAWVNYYWYKPGKNTPDLKHAYVRKAQHGAETYVVGSRFYVSDEEKKMSEIKKMTWEGLEKEKLSDRLTRQVVSGERATLVQLTVKRGGAALRHSHANEEYCLISSGSLKLTFDDREVVVKTGDIMIIPANVPHAMAALEDSIFIEFFTPIREDWLRGEDQYLRKQAPFILRLCKLEDAMTLMNPLSSGPVLSAWQRRCP